jgi:hypothetical protein
VISIKVKESVLSSKKCQVACYCVSSKTTTTKSNATETLIFTSDVRMKTSLAYVFRNDEHDKLCNVVVKRVVKAVLEEMNLWANYLCGSPPQVAGQQLQTDQLLPDIIASRKERSLGTEWDPMNYAGMIDCCNST